MPGLWYTRFAKFLSTPSARRATRSSVLDQPAPVISIHALREEDDPRNLCTGHDRRYFYPRPPRGGRPAHRPEGDSQCYFYPRPPRGGRRAPQALPLEARPFLSTPSARRATQTLDSCLCDVVHFYPRPPRGGRPQQSRRPRQSP